MVSLINKLLFKPLVLSRSEFYCIKSPWLYAAILKGHLVGLENVRIEKLHYNVRYQYIPPECVMQGLVWILLRLFQRNP